MVAVFSFKVSIFFSLKNEVSFEKEFYQAMLGNEEVISTGREYIYVKNCLAMF